MTIFTGLMMLLFLASSCKKDNTNGSSGQTQTQIINQWIYDGMKSVYFWNQSIPSGLDPLTETDSKAFFYKMLYTTRDKWSYITDNYTALMADLNGEPLSMGYSPMFGKIANTNNVAIFVEFVYPGSPADSVGLTRGDFIMSIDGQTLTIDNYYDLYSKNNYVAGLGDYSTGSLKPNGRTVSLSSEVIAADPVFYHTVIDTGGVKTGYLVFTEFTAGSGNKYLTELANVLDDFKSQGISDLIVDLRYNPGGAITVAQYLASCLAPAANITNKDILVTNKYNTEVNQYLVSSEGSDSPSLVTRFIDTGHNLNLGRICFITGRGTASASELTITGLEPYMQVITVGDTTVGKYTGMWVIPDTKNPPRHNWAMMPVVLKYANASGYTDFFNGLAPDYYVADDLHAAKPFGDLSDPMLAKAIEVVTGVSLPTAEKKAGVETHFIPIKPRYQQLKENLILPAIHLSDLLESRPASPELP